LDKVRDVEAGRTAKSEAAEQEINHNDHASLSSPTIDDLSDDEQLQLAMMLSLQDDAPHD
jgi:hypothetical protein